METKVIYNGEQINYLISDCGEITNLKTGRKLKGTWARLNYHSVQLTINGKPKSCLTGKLLKDSFLNNPIEEIPEEIQLKVKQVLEETNNFSKSVEKFNKKELLEKKMADPNIEWKTLSINPLYKISNNGVIYNTQSNRYSLGEQREKYLRVNINNSYYSIHRLLWESFKGEIPENYVIDHIDGNGFNNNLDNLRCVSQSDNMFNAQSCGHKGQCKVGQYDGNGNLIKEWPSFTVAAKEMGVTSAAIRSAADRNGTSCGYKWKRL